MDSFFAKPFKAADLLDALQPIADARGPRPVAAPVAAADTAADAPPATTTSPLEPEVPETAAAADAQSPVTPAAVDEAVAAPELDAPAVNALLESTGTHTAPPSRLPVLDLEQVQAIRGLGKPMVFERLCDMLYASSKDAFARLDAAIAEENLEEVAAAAHAFKSPVNNLGGRRLADLLERCETAALDGADIAQVRRSAAGLKAHYAALVAALQAETRRATGTG